MKKKIAVAGALLAMLSMAGCDISIGEDESSPAPAPAPESSELTEADVEVLLQQFWNELGGTTTGTCELYTLDPNGAYSAFMFGFSVTVPDAEVTEEQLQALFETNCPGDVGSNETP